MISCQKISGEAAKSASVGTFPMKLKFLDFQYLMGITPGDDELVTQIMNTFRKKSEGFMRKMEEHFSTRDFDGVEKTAHALKPVGAYLGVNDLYALLHKIESAACKYRHTEIRPLMAQARKLVNGINREIDLYRKVICAGDICTSSR